MKRFARYINGNYTVTIDTKTGTKLRENELDFFDADFPESIDLKITANCNLGCPYCHEDSQIDGEHADILNFKFIENLPPYTEIAIGGGNPLAHPDLIPFLVKCKSLNLIPSITVNQNHFRINTAKLRKLCDAHLIYGLGISINAVDPRLVDQISSFPNAVCHIVAGTVDKDFFDFLAYKNLKILILGYKDFGRGIAYHANNPQIDNNIYELRDLLVTMKDQDWFKVISFDNLAIKQLDVKRLLSDAEYNEFYMGDDGTSTMFIDLVSGKFAKSSISTNRYPITDDIKDMFNIIKHEPDEI